MEKGKSLYANEYKEIKCIGRGNFGSAYLVESKNGGDKFVAK